MDTETGGYDHPSGRVIFRTLYLHFVRRLYIAVLFILSVILIVLLLLWRQQAEMRQAGAWLETTNNRINEAVPVAPTQSINYYPTTIVERPPLKGLESSVTLADLQGLFVKPADAPALSGDISGTFDTGLTVGANAVTLGTDTTGNYLSDVVAGNGLSVTGSNSEGSTPTIDVVLNTSSGLTFSDGGLTLQACAASQILKYISSAWSCAADVDTDTNTTYSAGTGLSLASTTFSLDSSLAMFKTIDATLGSDPVADGLTDTLTLSSGNGVNVAGDASADSLTFSLNLASGGGLSISGGALTLLNDCSNTQYLGWTSGSSSWGCTSLSPAPNIFQTVAGDTGSAAADSSSDSVTLVGGNGLSSAASDVSDTVTLNIDLASGSGMAFSSGALSLQACSEGQVLKYISSAWACAADNYVPASAYKQQLAGTDNVTIGASLTPLLTNGSGTAQSLAITIPSGNEVSLVATIEASSTLATGPVTFVIIRDDNSDNDCATGGGDGTQIGGQTTSFIASTAQSFTTTISFADSSPSATTVQYQLCASTTIALGTAAAADRSVILHEVAL